MCEVAVAMYFKIPLWQRPGLPVKNLIQNTLRQDSRYSIWDSNTVPLPCRASGMQLLHYQA